jgi:hypothetical protein
MHTGNMQSGTGAEQPTPRDSTDCSVEQPASPAPFKTLADLRRWAEHLPEAERRTDPIRRVHEALRILELESSRDARAQLRAILKSWDIKQKKASNKKRNLHDVRLCLVEAVLAEGNRLRASGSFSSRASFGNLFRSRAVRLEPRPLA